MFYVTIFLILFIRQILYIFLTVLSGIIVIYYSDSETSPKYKTYSVQAYLISVYLMEGMFMAGMLFMFWVFRLSYYAGQVSGNSQILLITQRIKNETKVYYCINLVIIIAIVIIFYVFFLLRAANALTDIAISTFFAVSNDVLSIVILILILIYAIRYAGNPASNLRYKRTISKTRTLLIVMAFTRMVSYCYFEIMCTQ